MSQGEIIEVLEKQNKPISALQIAKLIGKGRPSIDKNLRKLRSSNEIRFTYSDYDDKHGGQARKVYWI